ncbi:hypothetical protein [Actinosynnema sp. NPDC023587]|uniref:hypothetical protein n=1 Tax=Actinosynnema sp. NPDC023587 TaxID=3154695 RepID=UPI0033FB9CA2
MAYERSADRVGKTAGEVGDLGGFVWLAPDGTAWRLYNSHPVELTPMVYDQGTGQYRSDRDAPHREISRDEFEAQYRVAPTEPLRDPRITHLGELVERLLDDYQAATGRPSSLAEEIGPALDAVRGIPEEAARRRFSAAEQAGRHGFERGRRRRG